MIDDLESMALKMSAIFTKLRSEHDTVLEDLINAGARIDQLETEIKQNTKTSVYEETKHFLNVLGIHLKNQTHINTDCKALTMLGDFIQRLPLTSRLNIFGISATMYEISSKVNAATCNPKREKELRNTIDKLILENQGKDQEIARLKQQNEAYYKLNKQIMEEMYEKEDEDGSK
jgi:flagellar motility protein MotE (MotC chaperone)